MADARAKEMIRDLEYFVPERPKIGLPTTIAIVVLEVPEGHDSVGLGAKRAFTFMKTHILG